MLKMRLSELDRVRITKDNGWSVHFTTHDLRHYFVKQYDGDGECFFKLWEKGRPADVIASAYGTMPRLPYLFSCKVYKQARVKLWLLALAERGLVEIVREDLGPMNLHYAKSRLATDELAVYMGIRFSGPLPCEKCSVANCPFRSHKINRCTWKERISCAGE